jgi:hypothetical protein
MAARRRAQVKRRRHSPEQVIRQLEGEELLAEGQTVEEVAGSQKPGEHRLDLPQVPPPVRRLKAQDAKRP